MIKYFFSGLILLSINVTAVALPTAKLTLKVVDENGLPVEGAKAGIALYGKKNSSARGITNNNGFFTGSGATQNLLGYLVRKEGYYRSSGQYSGFNSISGIIGFRRWEPWNPTVGVVLKKKINPTPLYAVKIDSRFSNHLPTLPVLGQFVGYDLIAGDWVVPHGQGTHRDFLFKLEKHRAASRRDHHVTLTLKFPYEGDGIRSYYAQPNTGSALRLPYHAPSTGYEPEIVFDKNRTKTKIISGDIREDQNYFFRVRTEKDEEGNIVSALYGKIHGAIELGSFVGPKSPTGSVYFTYYLNPTPNDTNLEFDTRKNLFTDLSKQEKVRLP